MHGEIYPYDIELFNRNFLNCAQRHSLVMLAERGVTVEYLFYNSFISSDWVLEQAIVQSIPKYNFTSAFLSEEDYLRVGVTKTCHFVEKYEDAKDHILRRVKQDGFVLLAGDVFYFEHCPEYRNHHLFHLIVLKKFQQNENAWAIVDDNPASVLTHYSYPESQVSDFYNNNNIREYRCYAQKPVELSCLRNESLTAFRDFLDKRSERFTLLSSITEISQAPYQAPALLYQKLHDACSLLSGSRRCVATFVSLYDSNHPSVNIAMNSSVGFEKLRNTFVRAKLTDRLSLEKLKHQADDLLLMERELLESIGRITH
jgi:hypothetical protein